MIGRRTFLKLGAAGVAGELVSVPTRLFGAMPSDSHSSFYRAVFDERFEECRAFAGEMNRRGVVTSGIRGDVATLWYKDMRVRMLQSKAPIAGLTDRIGLFCLEELARDVDMKVFFRVDHVKDGSGHIQHEAAGPALVVELTRRLSDGSELGRASAALVCGYEMSGSGEIAAQKRTGPFSPEDKTALVSWIIG